jgi:hypothetical protein
MAKNNEVQATDLSNYEIRHLVNHLFEFGRWDYLHKLLSLEKSDGSNYWYCAWQSIGDKEGYSNNLALGWRAAEEADQLNLQCRYALMVSSINSTARNVPPALVFRAVDSGLWNLEQAKTQARFTPEPVYRVEVLFGLTPYVPTEKQDQHLSEVIESARQIPTQTSRPSAQGEDFTFTSSLLQRAVAVIWPAISADTFCRTLAALGFEEQAIQALSALEPNISGLHRQWYEGEIAYRLPKSIQDVPPQIHLAFDNRELEREGIIKDGLDMLVPIKEAYHLMARVIAALAPILSSDGLDDLVKLSRKILNDQARGQALIAIAPFASSKLLDRIFKHIRQMKSENAIADALIGIGPYLSAKKRRQAFRVLRTFRKDFERNRAQARLLVGLGPTIPSKNLKAVLGQVRRIRHPLARGIALVGLAPLYSGEKRRELLQKGTDLCQQGLETVRRYFGTGAERTNAYAEALMDPFPGLDKTTREHVMTEAVLAPGGRHTIVRPRLKATLAIDLAELGCHSEALTMIKSNVDLPEFFKAGAISLATRSVEIGSPNEIFSITDLIVSFPDALREIIQRAAYRIPDDLLPTTLEVASQIGDRLAAAHCLIELLPNLPESFATQALDFIGSDPQQGEYAQMLAGIAIHLPENKLTEVARLARKLESDYEKERVLCNLILRQVKRDNLDTVIKQIGKFRYNRFKVEVLSKLSVIAREDRKNILLADAEKLAQEIQEGLFMHEMKHRSMLKAETSVKQLHNDRADAFLALLPQTQGAMRERVMAAALDAARAASWERKTDLRAWDSFERIEGIKSLYDEEADRISLGDYWEARKYHRESAQRSDWRMKWNKVLYARYLSNLGPILPVEEINHLIKDAAALPSSYLGNYPRDEALSSLAPRVPATKCALQAIQKIENPAFRAIALARLAETIPDPQPNKLLDQADDIMKSVDNISLRSRYLASLAYLPPRELARAWYDQFPRLSTGNRLVLLGAFAELTPILRILGGKETISDIFGAIQDVTLWWP